MITVLLAFAVGGPWAGQDPHAKEPAPLVDQGLRHPALRGFRCPPDLELALAAQEPTLVNPVGLAFAPDGTAHVLEWGARDAVKALRASQPGGPLDQAAVVLEVARPTALAFHQEWLYVASQGAVTRHRRSQEGGPYDVREVVARGFAGPAPYQVTGLAVGPDGWLYVAAGPGDHAAEGAGGSRATVLGTGAVFRCRPNGAGLHAFATGLGNAALAFDAAGALFALDHRPGHGTLFHVAEGTDLDRQPRGLVGWGSQDLNRPGGPTANALSGLAVYGNTLLPEAYRDLLLLTWPEGEREVLAYRPEAKGATFAVAGASVGLVRADDPRFHPCQVVPGPDGAVYVLDRRSADAQRPEGEGRLYRLTPRPARPLDPKPGLPAGRDADLLQALASDDLTDRRRAQAELERRARRQMAFKPGGPILPALTERLADPAAPGHQRAAALGILVALGDVAEVRPALWRALAEGEADLKRLAAEGLGLVAPAGDGETHDALAGQLTSTSDAVRRAAALAIGRVGATGAADVLAGAFRFDDGHDPALTDGLLRALERVGPAGLDRLTALATSGTPQDLHRAVQALLTMRTRAAAEAIPALLDYPHLTDAEVAQLLGSYRHYQLDPPVDLEPVGRWLEGHPTAATALRLAALGALAHPRGKQGPTAGRVLPRLLDAAEAPVRAAAAEALLTGPVKAEAARQVGQALRDGKLPAEMRPQVLGVLRRFAADDPGCAEVLRALEK